MEVLRTYSSCGNYGYINQNSYRTDSDCSKVNLEKFFLNSRYSWRIVYNTNKNINPYLRHTDINKKILGVDNLAHTLKIEIVEGDGLVLKFKNPFIIAYTKEEEGFSYDNDDLGIYLYGKNLKELKEDFEENIIVAWELYVDCNESELNSGAIKLRNKLKELIEAV